MALVDFLAISQGLLKVRFRVGDSQSLLMQKEKPKSSGREMKLMSSLLPLLPIIATITVTETHVPMYADRLFVDTYNDWMMPEKMLKDLCMSLHTTILSLRMILYKAQVVQFLVGHTSSVRSSHRILSLLYRRIS